MKKLSEIVGPVSWIFVVLSTYGPLFIMLHPSWKEVGILAFVDLVLMAPVNLSLLRIVFFKIYPQFKSFFDGLTPEQAQNLEPLAKVRLVETMFEFPSKWAVYVYVAGFIKAIPAFCVVVFVWKHEVSNTQQFTLMLLLTLVNWTFAFNSIVTESHIFLSKLLTQIHDTFDWRKIFAQCQVKYSRKSVAIQEWLSLFHLSLFTLILQIYFLEFGKQFISAPISLMVFGIGIVGLILFSRNFLMYRNYITSGLENIFEAMSKIDPLATRIPHLPLHSHPLLARFEQSFNSLIDRLEISRRDLSRLVIQEVDKERFETLGRVSGLVAHDLSSPIHTISFCVEQIKENPEKLRDAKYIDQLGVNAKRAIDLIDSLRSKLRNPSDSGATSKLPVIHSQVVSLLKTQYTSDFFDKINFTFDLKFF